MCPPSPERSTSSSTSLSSSAPSSSRSSDEVRRTTNPSTPGWLAARPAGVSTVRPGRPSPADRPTRSAWRAWAVGGDSISSLPDAPIRSCSRPRRASAARAKASGFSTRRLTISCTRRWPPASSLSSSSRPPAVRRHGVRSRRGARRRSPPPGASGRNPMLLARSQPDKRAWHSAPPSASPAPAAR